MLNNKRDSEDSQMYRPSLDPASNKPTIIKIYRQSEIIHWV